MVKSLLFPFLADRRAFCGGGGGPGGDGPSGGYTSIGDMFDGGGPGKSGDTYGGASTAAADANNDGHVSAAEVAAAGLGVFGDNNDGYTNYADPAIAAALEEAGYTVSASGLSVIGKDGQGYVAGPGWSGSSTVSGIVDAVGAGQIGATPGGTPGNDYSDIATFSQAFAAARSDLGKNQVFSWGGQQFSTSIKGEDPALDAAIAESGLPSSGTEMSTLDDLAEQNVTTAGTIKGTDIAVWSPDTTDLEEAAAFYASDHYTDPASIYGQDQIDAMMADTALSGAEVAAALNEANDIASKTGLMSVDAKKAMGLDPLESYLDLDSFEKAILGLDPMQSYTPASLVEAVMQGKTTFSDMKTDLGLTSTEGLTQDQAQAAASNLGMSVADIDAAIANGLMSVADVVSAATLSEAQAATGITPIGLSGYSVVSDYANGTATIVDPDMNVVSMFPGVSTPDETMAVSIAAAHAAGLDQDATIDAVFDAIAQGMTVAEAFDTLGLPTAAIQGSGTIGYGVVTGLDDAADAVTDPTATGDQGTGPGSVPGGDNTIADGTATDTDTFDGVIGGENAEPDIIGGEGVESDIPGSGTEGFSIDDVKTMLSDAWYNISGGTAEELSQTVRGLGTTMDEIAEEIINAPGKISVNIAKSLDPYAKYSIAGYEQDPIMALLGYSEGEIDPGLAKAASDAKEELYDTSLLPEQQVALFSEIANKYGGEQLGDLSIDQYNQISEDMQQRQKDALPAPGTTMDDILNGRAVDSLGRPYGTDALATAMTGMQEIGDIAIDTILSVLPGGLGKVAVGIMSGAAGAQSAVDEVTAMIDEAVANGTLQATEQFQDALAIYGDEASAIAALKDRATEIAVPLAGLTAAVGDTIVTSAARGTLPGTDTLIGKIAVSAISGGTTEAVEQVSTNYAAQNTGIDIALDANTGGSFLQGLVGDATGSIVGTGVNSISKGLSKGDLENLSESMPSNSVEKQALDGFIQSGDNFQSVVNSDGKIEVTNIDTGQKVTFSTNQTGQNYMDQLATGVDNVQIDAIGEDLMLTNNETGEAIRIKKDDLTFKDVLDFSNGIKPEGSTPIQTVEVPSGNVIDPFVPDEQGKIDAAIQAAEAFGNTNLGSLENEIGADNIQIDSVGGKIRLTNLTTNEVVEMNPDEMTFKDVIDFSNGIVPDNSTVVDVTEEQPVEQVLSDVFSQRIEELQNNGATFDEAYNSTLVDMADEMGITPNELLVELGLMDAVEEQPVEKQPVEQVLSDVFSQRIEELQNNGATFDEAYNSTLVDMADEMGITPNELLVELGLMDAVEEQPVEEQPVEEQPVEEQPVEEQPVEEQPVEEQPVEEQPVEEQPVEEQPVEEQPVEEQPVEEQPVEEQPVEEQPVEDVIPAGQYVVEAGSFQDANGKNYVLALTDSEGKRYGLSSSDRTLVDLDTGNKVYDNNEGSLSLPDVYTSFVESTSQDVIEQPVEDVTEDVVEQPVEDVTEDVIEQPVEDVTEDVVEQPVEDVTEDVIEQPVEDVTEDVTEQPVEDVTEDVIEQPVEDVTEDVEVDVTEDVTEQPVEDVTEDVVEQPVEDVTEDVEVDVTEDVIEQPVEDVTEDVIEQPVEDVTEDVEVDVTEDVIEQPVEDVTEDVIEQPVEDVTEDVIEQPVEDVTEDVIEQPVEDVTEDVVEQPVEDVTEDVEVDVEPVEDVTEDVEVDVEPVEDVTEDVEVDVEPVEDVVEDVIEDTTTDTDVDTTEDTTTDTDVGTSVTVDVPPDEEEPVVEEPVVEEPVVEEPAVEEESDFYYERGESSEDIVPTVDFECPDGYEKVVTPNGGIICQPINVARPKIAPYTQAGAQPAVNLGGGLMYQDPSRPLPAPGYTPYKPGGTRPK